MDTSSLSGLLLLRPGERSTLHLQYLVTATAPVKFFQSLSPHLHSACCKVMHLVEYPAHTVVYNKGDPGDSFYIIISGSVNAFIPQNSVTPLASLKPIGLSVGQTFGELALLQNTSRAATMQTRENTLLAVLDKVDFSHILHRIEDKRLRIKVDFLRNLPAFAQWSEARMQRLAYFFLEMLCVKGQVIYRQDDPSDNVYVSISGEFQFLHDLVGSKSGTLRRKKAAVLTVMGGKELFGEREVISGKNRQSTCVCSSPTGSLYYIPKEYFLTFYQKRSTQIYIQRVIDEKERWLHVRKSQILRAEKAINADKLQITPKAKSTIGHFSLNLSLRQDLQKFSNLSVLKSPIGVSSVRSKETSTSVGNSSHTTAISPIQRLPTRKSFAYSAALSSHLRRFSAVI